MFHHDTPEEADFRRELRQWLEANLPQPLRGRAVRPPPEEMMPWYKKLSQKGWIAPHWPKKHGGMGASLNQQIIFTEETARIGAPYLPTQGLNNIGPILMEFGTEAQKARHLPPILARRRDLGAGLFRARRGLRPGQPDDQRNAQGRSFHRPRAEDLADLGPPCRLDVHAGAHRSAGAATAGRHQLPLDRPAQPRRPRAADQDHRRR